MSVKNLIAKFEQEQVEIQAKIDALKERDRILGLMLKELASADESVGPQQQAGGAKTGGAKTGGRKPGKARAKKSSGSMTVRDAIMKAVTAAKDAIPANEIIAEASRLSGGAVASIRTQLNALTRGGELKQVPYEGRGFKYQVGSGSAPSDKPGAKGRKSK